MAVTVQEFGYQASVHANAGTSKNPKYLPSFDAFYGPYESKQEAFDKLSTDKFQLCIGKTVGIIEDGKIVEYWFESAYETVDDLVPKLSALTEDQMNAISAIIGNIDSGSSDGGDYTIE